MNDNTTYNVLFLCTGNSARSIMAEVLLNAMGKGRFRAHSAGSHPRDYVHPFALELIQKNRLSVQGLRSKDWSEYSRADAPRWISCSQCATTRPPKSARSGRASP
jgi:arsenate reductase